MPRGSDRVGGSSSVLSQAWGQGFLRLFRTWEAYRRTRYIAHLTVPSGGPPIEGGHMSPDEVVLGSDYKRFPPHVLLANFFGSNANPDEKFSAPVKHDSLVAMS